MKKLSKETENKIIENNNTISMLLTRNEDLYLSELNDFERRIFPVSDVNKIFVPKEYVRKKDDFIEQYSLKKITDNLQHQNNIAYLMQYGDLMHYFFTRFYVFGQLEKAHYYHEILNIATILETILKELAQNYRNICSNCILHQNCQKIINKAQISDLKVLLNRLSELKIIDLDANKIQTLYELVDLRNKIHIRLMDCTIGNNTKYTTHNYNNYMLTFKYLINSINFNNIKCAEIDKAFKVN